MYRYTLNKRYTEEFTIKISSQTFLFINFRKKKKRIVTYHKCVGDILMKKTF
jgi:hypothetical protein